MFDETVRSPDYCRALVLLPKPFLWQKVVTCLNANFSSSLKSQGFQRTETICRMLRWQSPFVFYSPRNRKRLRSLSETGAYLSSKCWVLCCWEARSELEESRCWWGSSQGWAGLGSPDWAHSALQLLLKVLWHEVHVLGKSWSAVLK